MRGLSAQQLDQAPRAEAGEPFRAGHLRAVFFVGLQYLCLQALEAREEIRG
jgi:hypothetical protein